ncbi:protein of unknown function [Serratia sp. Tan611]|nr:protein of unknown function [Serratia sp. Tan611]
MAVLSKEEGNNSGLAAVCIYIINHANGFCPIIMIWVNRLYRRRFTVIRPRWLVLRKAASLRGNSLYLSVGGF